MEWEIMGPMMVAIVGILTTGGVLVLRPIAKRVSDLLELYAHERTSGTTAELRQMRDLLETMNARLQLVEDRQDFTERLLGSGPSPTASAHRLNDPVRQPPESGRAPSD